MIKLRGIPFPEVLTASGVRNFFGEGWWYHRFLTLVGITPSWLDSHTAFVAKTTTFDSRAGNMPLRQGTTSPTELVPKCIRVNARDASVLNSVGLSGPGAAWLLAQGKWQARRYPFFLSFMAVDGDEGQKLDQAKAFVDLLGPALPSFTSPVGLQVNLSCPNTGERVSEMLAIAERLFRVLNPLGIPLVGKVNAFAPPEALVRISELDACDALSISNTAPWADLPEDVRQQAFGSTTSPLAHIGGGGYSGRHLLPYTLRALRAYRLKQQDLAYRGSGAIRKPLFGGGGVLSPADAESVLVDADGLEIGSIFMLRPWRVRATVEHAHNIIRKKGFST